MKVGDVVKIKRGKSLDWKVLRVDGDRALVDLLHGSLLGPQWENVNDLEQREKR